MNKENLQKVIDVIEDNPHSWNQKQWHCGTTHCFAGHAQILSGKKEDEITVRTDARIFLDMNFHKFNWVVSSIRTLEDFKSLLNDTDFDIEGFNIDGFDIDGFNCYGYARDGYDCNDHCLPGYNSDGYNSDGVDRAGFDRDGFDLDGLDINNKPRD